MNSWLPVHPDSDLSLHNLPYGTFSTSTLSNRIGTAVGDHVLDLRTLAEDGIFDCLGFDASTLRESTLNKFANLGREAHRALRKYLQELLREDTPRPGLLRDHIDRRNIVVIPLDEVQMHLPMELGDYTDFFVGLHHAQNCSKLFGHKGVPASYFDCPLAYHGRASSVVVSGTNSHRPHGQMQRQGETVFGPTTKLDFEVELAAFISRGNKMGDSIDADNSEDQFLVLC
ncbi:hypothetical protein VTN77DRAFT_1426 [Rasamsonia byssochlamydoides]|uniref:uncharacterized protein n=1 Tax=Rasamsonia byssochlamydoides TaxID=89139 RepID=UPI003742AF54